MSARTHLLQSKTAMSTLVAAIFNKKGLARARKDWDAAQAGLDKAMDEFGTLATEPQSQENLAKFRALINDYRKAVKPVADKLVAEGTFVEAARALAERIMRRGFDDEQKVIWAFAETTSRLPSAGETKVLTGALARERARFARDTAAADALLAHGESPRDASLPAVDHAAWTQVAAVLLNLSETVTRN